MTTLENNENFYLHFPVVPRVERVAAIEEGNYPLPLESPIGARISVSHRSFSYLLSRRKETDLCTGQSIVRAWPRENEMERDFACISRTIRKRKYRVDKRTIRIFLICIYLWRLSFRRRFGGHAFSKDCVQYFFVRLRRRSRERAFSPWFSRTVTRLVS